MTNLARCYNIADLRAAAQRRLPRGLFEFIDRGTEDEVALQRNRAAIERIALRPRMAIDVSARSTATTLFGKPVSMPLAIAPTGGTGLVWYEGELELARAAKAAGVPFTLALISMTALERVAREVGGRLWLQLYLWADRAMSYDVVARAEALGFEALMVTVDTPVGPNREYNARNGFVLPFHPPPRAIADLLMHPRWFAGTLLRYLATSGMPHYANHPVEFRRMISASPGARAVAPTDSVCWDDIARLRERWKGTLIVKGILHPGDAETAVGLGADGVLVSNHGGRNLDGAMASFAALPAVAAAVGTRATVLVDSGVRRGGDIVKALALGAQAVLTGRATLWGTAVAGQAGAAKALSLLQYEMDNNMAMAGCAEVAQIGPEMLA